MTREKCLEVVDRYERFLAPLGPKKKDREMVEHILGMLPQMRSMLDTSEPNLGPGYPISYFKSQRNEKFMRWLGFIQGVLWQRKWFTLEELKEHNRP